jgi:predicted Zn-dependent protease
MADSYSAWRDLIEILTENGQTTQALEASKYAAENLKDPKERLVAQLDYARLLLSSGDLSEALYQLNKILAIEQTTLVQISVDKLAKLYVALVNLKKGATIETLRTLDSILVG